MTESEDFGAERIVSGRNLRRVSDDGLGAPLVGQLIVGLVGQPGSGWGGTLELDS